MKNKESGIVFDFAEGVEWDKFDETDFYQKHFKKMNGAKGVDFILKTKDSIILIEVKNCFRFENENRWRIFPDNSKKETIATKVDTDDRNSLDIEIPQKVSMTLACLIGAHSRPFYENPSDLLKPYFNFTKSNEVPSGSRRIKVVLFLEGDFSKRSLTQKAIMTRLGDKIKGQLSWLNCKVIVENIGTHKKDYYTARFE